MRQWGKVVIREGWKRKEAERKRNGREEGKTSVREESLQPEGGRKGEREGVDQAFPTLATLPEFITGNGHIN